MWYKPLSLWEFIISWLIRIQEIQPRGLCEGEKKRQKDLVKMYLIFETTIMFCASSFEFPFYISSEIMTSFNLRVWASWINAEWQKPHFVFIHFSTSSLFFHLMRLSGFFELALVNVITNFEMNNILLAYQTLSLPHMLNSFYSQTLGHLSDCCDSVLNERIAQLQPVIIIA